MLCIRLEALWNDLPPEADFFALLALQMRFSKGKTVLFNFKTVKIFPCGAGVWTESRGGHLQNDPNQGARPPRAPFFSRLRRDFYNDLPPEAENLSTSSLTNAIF